MWFQATVTSVYGDNLFLEKVVYVICLHMFLEFWYWCVLVFYSFPDFDGSLGVFQMISVLQIFSFGLCSCEAVEMLQAYTMTCSSSVLVLKSLEIVGEE